MGWLVAVEAAMIFRRGPAHMRSASENGAARRRYNSRLTRERPHMAHAIRFHKTGGPEVLQWEDVNVPAPAQGECQIRHKAVGLNYIDTYHRTGLYPVPLPSGIGLEAAGVVEAVGPGVSEFKAGDRVALC